MNHIARPRLWTPGRPIDRRRFLTIEAGAVGIIGLAACGDDDTADCAGHDRGCGCACRGHCVVAGAALGGICLAPRDI
jgi:hypothetical protein